MTILRTTELPPFGNQICIYWAAGGPPQCARLIRWHCWGSIHALARSTKLLECGEDKPPPLQLICNSTQARSKHCSSMTDALSASSPSHKDELNVRQNSNAHRAKQVQHHTSMKRYVYIFFPCKALKCASLPLRSSFLQFQSDPLRWQLPCLLNTMRCIEVPPPEYRCTVHFWNSFYKVFLSMVLWFWGFNAMTTPTLPLKHYLLNSRRCTEVPPPEYRFSVNFWNEFYKVFYRTQVRS